MVIFLLKIISQCSFKESDLNTPENLPKTVFESNNTEESEEDLKMEDQKPIIWSYVQKYKKYKYKSPQILPARLIFQ